MSSQQALCDYTDVALWLHIDYLKACLACPIAMHVEGPDVVQAGTQVRGLRQSQCHNQQG